MFWNVFRPGNFSQKWIFYDEKTEKTLTLSKDNVTGSDGDPSLKENVLKEKSEQ